MTKYFLHGGATSKKEGHNNEFFKAVLGDFPERAKILLVYFASERERWESVFQNDQQNFSSNSPGKKLEFVLANDSPEIFERQVKTADVIYIRGGSSSMLLKTMRKFPHFKEWVKEKVYAGSSAGASMLARYYYPLHGHRVEKSLGILPIKVINHWDESKRDRLEALKKHGEDLPVYPLPETGFVVLER